MYAARDCSLRIAVSGVPDKKLLSYDVIVAWILKSCTKEFSQYRVQFIMDNCLKEKRENGILRYFQRQHHRKGKRKF
jgi:hypothetical protein